MRFRTEVNVPKADFEFTHNDALLWMGSCFAEEIGSQCEGLKFETVINPFGILFNPKIIAMGLRRMMENRPFEADELIEHQGVWKSLHHHSKFTHSSQEECLTAINRHFEAGVQQLSKASYLVITFGTAWAYQYNETGMVVANCHKIPQQSFDKVLLKQGEIVRDYSNLLEQLEQFNPNVQVLFTVSPVRHWKDGAVENQRSKAQLIAAVHELVEQYKWCAYFPSYEIVMDDLRDYRFYKEDLLHPSAAAVQYIWERFSTTYFSELTQQINTELNQIQRLLEHRPLHPETEEHQQFLRKTESKIREFAARNPMLNMEPELLAIRQQFN